MGLLARAFSCSPSGNSPSAGSASGEVVVEPGAGSSSSSAAESLTRPEVRVTVIELVAGDSMMMLYPLRFTGEEDCAALPTVVATEAAAPCRATAGGVSSHVGGRKEARGREVGGHA